MTITATNGVIGTMPRVRSNFSKKNPYWLPPEKFLEVYYFALQFHDWKKEYNSSLGARAVSYDGMPGSTFHEGSETEDLAIRLMNLSAKIDFITRTVHEACVGFPGIEPYLLRGVTERGVTYNTLLHEGIPYNRNIYYNLRHKFYYNLSQKR
ncbi:MAG: hypothetical protein J6T99_09455 [Oscillospiraceae bacterium]|nr:hypothetical protein [Oscillospiraceae bacterium]